MMSKKQWFVLLCFFWLYLLLGAAIFFYVESQEELRKQFEDLEEKQIIGELLQKHYHGDSKSVQHIFNRLTDYCGKPVNYNMSSTLPELKWDFYHSLFFVITVVSTIGYGNLAPTTMFTRIFMIFYGLIGIPMNGIVMVTMGEYFAKSFKKLYRRWKNVRIEKSYAKLGLVGQIILYAVPGLTFFIFLPSTIISVFEGWKYDISVYYSFVTLTTIGFGDYVAGVANVNSFSPLVVGFYQMFLLIWVIGGLGYVVMIINFITSAMRSRRILKIEKMLAENIKRTPQRIRNEFRTLLQEFLFFRVKPIYKDEFDYVPKQLERSQSCPEFTIWRKYDSESFIGKRARAMSECYKYPALKRTQSETELEKIDKERTFKPSDAFMQQKDLILKVVDALSASVTTPPLEEVGIHGFSDAEILASENYNEQKIVPCHRRRAISDIRPPPYTSIDIEPNNVTWCGDDASTALKKFRKVRALSTPDIDHMERPTFFSRLKHKLKFKDDKNDIEKQNLGGSQDFRRPSIMSKKDRKISTASVFQDPVLEHTSIADVIRALTTISMPPEGEEEAPQPYHEQSVTIPSVVITKPSPRQRRMSIIPQVSDNRRMSLSPERKINLPTVRRFSLRPVEEREQVSLATPFIVETRNSIHAMGRRKFSVKPIHVNLPSVSATSTSVKAQVTRKKRTENEH